MDHDKKTSIKTLIHPTQLLIRIKFLIIEQKLNSVQFNTHTTMKNIHDDTHLLDTHLEHNIEDAYEE